MKRSKRQKVKQENQEPVASSHGENEEHDLAYFIHDRVELMHQVFSILKPKEILAMAPRCVRGVSIQDLQELCTDELLGISSKRLCAVLDGAEPPSDTESSSASPEQMETISLDSISSDEEILSQSSSRKSKKHKHRRHSKKKEKDKSRENHKSKERDRAKSPSQTTKESRAGLTVLELLELQARARAIRAQLTKDKSLNKQVQSELPQSSVDSSSSGSEIEIKEEPALVVEISSEDEKPGPEQLREYLDNMPASTSNCTVTRREPSSSKQNETNNSTTKLVNDLIITVPRAKSNRKIKLNRHRISETNNIKDKPETEKDSNVPQKSNIEQKSATETVQTISVEKTSNSSNKKDKKRKDKKKTKKRKDNSEKEGSDHDEITLQLSDSEKMDLLEDLGGNKGKDSSSSNDSESSSEDSDVSSDNESSKQKKQDEPSKSDAEIVSTDNEKVSVKLNDQDKCTKEIPKASNQSEVNNLIVDNIDTIITTNTESPSKVVEEEKLDKDLETTSNDLKQSDETIGDKVEQIATDVEKESSNIKDSDVISSSCEEKQKAGHAEKKTSNIKESPKVECGIEEKPKVLPKKEIERLMVEEIGLNIESQLSISATSQDDRHSNVQQSNDVEPMDVDDVISEKSVEISNIKDLSIVETQGKDKGSKSIESSIRNSPKSSQNLVEVGNVLKETLHVVLAGDTRSVSNKQIDASGKRKADVKNKSDGEITDGGSSEIEAVDLQQEVVYISDDDKNEKMSKKKKKKDKKAKKEKKAKKSKSDFREDSDQNFFSDPKVSNKSVNAKNSENTVSDVNSKLSVLEQSQPLIIDEEDDICEVLELSDDSSCYEVEGVSLLSKEPTAEEIQALSSKIDEIDREEVVTDEQIREHENMLANKEQNESNIEDIENISWKDRYLSSRKVKMVLSTSSIFNAMRKKNKELKKKIEMAKKEAEKQLPEETPNSNDNINSNPLEEGSIEHFNALTGSTKYVNPVQENTENGDINETEQDANKDVTNEMKKDAKQLLKMYKRLLKYNDVNKQKDPNKKKKKKSKKSKDKSKDAANSISTEL